MKKALALTSVSLILFLSACTLGTLSPEQIQGTAYSLAETAVPLTMTAMPTNTVLPTETPQPISTSTPEPSPSPSVAITESPTVGATFAPTWTPYGQSEAGAAETAQADKTDFNAPLLLDNQSGEDVHFTILSPVYQEYEISRSMTLILPEGSYTFRAKVDNASYSGSFSITNGDKHVLSFYATKYHFSTP